MKTHRTTLGLEDLVRKWDDIPAHVCMQLVGARDEDLEQMGWLGIVEQWPYYDEHRAQPSTFMTIAARTRMLGEIKREKRRREITTFTFLAEIDAEDEWSEGFSLQGMDRLEEKQLHEVSLKSEQEWRWRQQETDVSREVKEAMDELPQESREIVYLRFWQGLDWRELGEHYHVHPKTVKYRLNTTLRALRARLSFLEE